MRRHSPAGARGDAPAGSPSRGAAAVRLLGVILLACSCASGAGTAKPGSGTDASAPPAPAGSSPPAGWTAPETPAPAAVEAPTAPAATLSPEPGWPRWLETPDGVAAEQTSGLSFVGRDAQGRKVFLVADDVGELWRMAIQGDDGPIELVAIPFEGAAKESLDPFPKKDIEEITYCPDAGRVLISMEGNNRKDSPDPDEFRRWLGIYEVTLEPSPMEALRATRLDRIPVPEWDQATRLASPNMGFEGLVLYGDTLLLGLEGISGGANIFADSTVIEIFDVARGTRLEVGTKPYGVVTITGLSMSPSRRYYGVDRNAARVFSFRIENGALSDFRSVPISMPGVHGVPYMLPSAESISVDDESFLWIAVDPWRYTPFTREGLTEHDLANFKKEIPLLYKFRDPFRSPAESTRSREG